MPETTHFDLDAFRSEVRERAKAEDSRVWAEQMISYTEEIIATATSGAHFLVIEPDDGNRGSAKLWELRPGQVVGKERVRYLHWGNYCEVDEDLLGALDDLVIERYRLVPCAQEG